MFVITNNKGMHYNGYTPGFAGDLPWSDLRGAYTFHSFSDAEKHMQLSPEWWVLHGCTIHEPRLLFDKELQHGNTRYAIIALALPGRIDAKNDEWTMEDTYATKFDDPRIIDYYVCKETEVSSLAECRCWEQVKGWEGVGDHYYNEISDACDALWKEMVGDEKDSPFTE